MCSLVARELSMKRLVLPKPNDELQLALVHFQDTTGSRHSLHQVRVLKWYPLLHFREFLHWQLTGIRSILVEFSTLADPTALRLKVWRRELHHSGQRMEFDRCVMLRG